MKAFCVLIWISQEIPACIGYVFSARTSRRLITGNTVAWHHPKPPYFTFIWLTYHLALSLPLHTIPQDITLKISPSLRIDTSLVSSQFSDSWIINHDEAHDKEVNIFDNSPLSSRVPDLATSLYTQCPCGCLDWFQPEWPVFILSLAPGPSI